MVNKQEMSLKMAKQRCAMQVEKGILKLALSRTHGNCKKAAILLNISCKSMLAKAKAYRLVGGGCKAASGKNNF
jgi:transcriptional regulator with PAS, ATPase and Fis domain